jgi:hypothetical protein
MFCFLLALLLQSPQPIEGLYLEDRANHVHGCYCEWSGESQTGGREAILAWHVLSGSYRSTDLAGAKFALVVRGERTLSIGLTERQSVLIVDAAASPAQQRAVQALLKDRFGYFLGSILRVLQAPLEIQVGGGAASLYSLPGATRWFDPFVPVTQPTLGTTEVSRYSGREFNFIWSRTEPLTSGYFGRFVLHPR